MLHHVLHSSLTPRSVASAAKRGRLEKKWVACGTATAKQAGTEPTTRVPDGAQSRLDVVSVEPYKSIHQCLRVYEIDVALKRLKNRRLGAQLPRPILSRQWHRGSARSPPSLKPLRFVLDQRRLTLVSLPASLKASFSHVRHHGRVSGIWQQIAGPPLNRRNRAAR